MTSEQNTSESGKVGYKNPPMSGRFVKGRSGNPKGRPKGSRNFKSDLEAELKELVSIREGDRPTKVTKQRAIIKSLVAGTIKGDRRAATSLLSMTFKLLDHKAEEAGFGELSPNDQTIIEAALKRRAAMDHAAAISKADATNQDHPLPESQDETAAALATSN